MSPGQKASVFVLTDVPDMKTLELLLNEAVNVAHGHVHSVSVIPDPTRQNYYIATVLHTKKDTTE